MLVCNYLSSYVIILCNNLTHFRELGQNYRNILVLFLVQIKTLKFASGIDWPLVQVGNNDDGEHGFLKWFGFSLVSILTFFLFLC